MRAGSKTRRPAPLMSSRPRCWTISITSGTRLPGWWKSWSISMAAMLAARPLTGTMGHNPGRWTMPTKKRQASASPANTEAQTQAPEFNPQALQGALRLISLMGGVGVGLLTYELLLKPIGNWPAVFIGLAAAFLARFVLIWLERLWIRALIRRAERRQLQRIADKLEESKPKREIGSKK